MKSCLCDNCVSACKHDPGRLVPADIRKISDELGISIHACMSDYLVRVPTTVRNETVYALAPAKRKGTRFVEEPGHTAGKDYSDIQGICIFLESNGDCTIHTVKPFECRAYMGCTHTFLGKPYREKTVEAFFARRWRTYVL
jgi:Fe-S-cluster containining protein